MNNSSAEVSSFGNLTEAIARSDNIYSSFPDSIYDQAMKGQLNANVPRRDSITMGTNDSLDILVNDGLQSQDSFGRWINQIMADSPCSVDDSVLESSISSGHESFVSSVTDHSQSSVPEQIFSITDISPAWAFSTERTKVFFFCECHTFFFFFLLFLNYDCKSFLFALYVSIAFNQPWRSRLYLLVFRRKRSGIRI